MQTECDSMPFDAIVIGGSYAGLSAALQLVRARRKVLVIDSGLRRNRYARHAHGFLGQDGRPPEAIAADGRAQVLAYPSAQWLDDTAVAAQAQDEGFVVTLRCGQRRVARRLVLAAGVVDDLPNLDGLSERWGTSVFHCPYCHGYELEQGRIGVLASGAMSLHQALLLPDWGKTTFLTQGVFVPDEAQRAALLARGVALETQPVVRVVDTATTELADGRRLVFDGLFVVSRTRMASPIPETLGCALEEGPLGAYLRTNEFKETSVPGVFACGDAARAVGSVALAVGDGQLAGMAVHQSLVFR